jgi:hypothetical protein
MIEIFDDFLASKDANALENIVSSHNFPWYATQTLSDKSEKMSLPLFSKHTNPIQFTHQLYDGKNVTSPLFEEVMSFFKDLPECKNSFLLRAKFNITVPHKEKQIHTPHVDSMNDKCVSYLYYVNDSDGPTRMYMNWWNTKKIQPQKGRLIRFPSAIIHSGNVPYNNSKRIVLNLMFEYK